MALPAVFVSHGSPMLPIQDSPARTFLTQLGAQLSEAKAVLCVSAHWQALRPTASVAQRPETLHDFTGFPPILYRMAYRAPGAEEVARRATSLLAAAGIPADTADRGLDHGAWIPLMLMFPDAKRPVAQLSIRSDLNPSAHLAMGEALAPLREDGVLVLASGGAVHPLGVPGLDPFAGTPVEWATEFDAWLADAVVRGDRDALVDYRSAPGARIAQYYPDHFMPLLVAFGAGGPGVRGRILHQSLELGTFSMAAYAFG